VYSIETGALCQIRIVGTCDNQQFISLFHYRFVDGPANPNGAQMLLDILNVFCPAGNVLEVYQNCIGQDIVDMEVYAQWIEPVRYVARRDINGPYVGVAPFDTRSANISTAITKKGELANRHAIGTLHMPAVPDNMIDNGYVSAGGLVDLQGLGDKMAVSLIVAGARQMEPCIYNRADYEQSVPIVSCSVQPTLRVSRRRTVGLGT